MNRMKFFFLISITFCLISCICSGTSDNGSSDDIYISNQILEPDSIFNIKIVSPEMLDTVRSNAGTKGQVLKVNKGTVIGIVYGNSLYIRGDINEDDFPLEKIIQDNTEVDIANHLINIAFGIDNARIEQMGSNLPYLIWFDNAYSKEDIDHVREYVEEINTLVNTIEFEEDEVGLAFLTRNYEPVPYNYYTISIITRELLEELEEDRNKSSDHIFKDNKGKIIGMVDKEHLWLVDSLSQKQRDFYLFKGILWSMGFHGETERDDSFFFSYNEDNVTLSGLDKEAIMLMYGGRIQEGMDLEMVETSLGLIDYPES